MCDFDQLGCDHSRFWNRCLEHLEWCGWNDYHAELLQKFGWLRDLLNTVIDGFNAISFADIGKLPPAEDWGEKLAMYRFIVFGALLVIVMALRPSGLFPSRRRELEFDAEYQEPEGVAWMAAADSGGVSSEVSTSRS